LHPLDNHCDDKQPKKGNKMTSPFRLDRRSILPTVSALALLGLAACQAEEEPTADPAAVQAVDCR